MSLPPLQYEGDEGQLTPTIINMLTPRFKWSFEVKGSNSDPSAEPYLGGKKGEPVHPGSVDYQTPKTPHLIQDLTLTHTGTGFDGQERPPRLFVFTPCVVTVRITTDTVQVPVLSPLFP